MCWEKRTGRCSAPSILRQTTKMSRLAQKTNLISMCKHVNVLSLVYDSHTVCKGIFPAQRFASTGYDEGNGNRYINNWTPSLMQHLVFRKKILR